MELTGKTAIVTGASEGIGKEIAIALAKEGVNLILFGLGKEKLEEVAKACGNNTKIYDFDITDDAVREKIVGEVLSSSEIDILINNAGVWHKMGDITTVSESKVHEVINVNLTSHILLTRQVLPSIRNRETAIINVVSKSGVTAQKGQSAYSASKWGMKGFTDVLREDTKEEPVRVGAIYQAGTNTGLFAKVGENVPLEKFTKPEDLAQVVVFMLSRPDKIWLNEVHVSY